MDQLAWRSVQKTGSMLGPDKAKFMDEAGIESKSRAKSVG